MRKSKAMFALIPFVLSATGCAALQPGAQPQGNTVTTKSVDHASQYIKVTKSEYDPNTNEARLDVQSVPDSDVINNNNEGIIDSDLPDGVVNFGTAQFADKKVRRIRVRHSNTNSELFNLPVRPESTNPAQSDTGTADNISNNRYRHITGNATGNTTGTYGTSANASIAGTATTRATSAAGIHLPPPGVSIDPNIRPLAGLNASPQAKVDALRSVGESKLGMHYVWGHNEDRGQVGFDCSNYTAYVYHHALGYSFTTMSRRQYSSVGVRASVSEMKPGDLIAFNQGSHVGIYMGNGQMLQMGGGTAKCCYLPLRPGSYWYNHISAVKHMF